MTLKSIEKTILKITPVERMKIVELILNSLNKPDRHIERAWVAESEKRYAAFKRGKSRAIPLEILRKRMAG